MWEEDLTGIYPKKNLPRKLDPVRELFKAEFDTTWWIHSWKQSHIGKK